jgi:hypothetical protein
LRLCGEKSVITDCPSGGKGKMKRCILFSLVALAASGIFCSSSLRIQAGEVIQGDIDGGEYGEVINCGFPNTIVLDGKLDDLVWQHAPWQKISASDATVPPPNDRNGSLKFATAADEEYLYVAAKITDDKVRSGENLGCDVWNDDSIEVYIDGGNEKGNTYDVNDAQITIGADVIDVEPDVKVLAGLLGGCVGITQGPQTETIATGEETADGWNVEIAIPLENAGWKIKPADGARIGFNIQYNDDDNGGDRDFKLIWSAEEVKLGEDSWENPSRFAELQFVGTKLAVDSRGKAVSTWASIKFALR